MAFHVACPITCRRICFCSLGFPPNLQSDKAKNEFLEEVARVEEFLEDPWLLRVRAKGTVQVAVPKVVAPPPPPAPAPRDGGDAEEMLSAQTKRAALQRKAAVASLVAEDYARRFESGSLLDASRDIPGEEKGQSNVKVMCRLCYSGENEGSERARKMLSCKSCGKKYHRRCLKAWAQHRDLFHWSSWTCPSCRICEVCRRTGDQTKFMFCRRCDGAYHCYCQQPSHKNVSSGPYLCPKHTRCHSCGSAVSGNGHSTRWFLGYTCCDACGRLFVKGNYCPVCLKVYRDSESTPMVCCDVCQRWVHCHCDGISEEKYLQFQVDGNLQYRCSTCRGECYQVRDLEDAVQELWRRKDEADRDLIASLRAAAGLPTQDEIFSISPYSDDEESGPVMLKNEYDRPLKFSLKGLVDKSPKKTKEYGKKSSSKKKVKKGHDSSLISNSDAHHSFEGHSDSAPFGYHRGDNNNNNVKSRRVDPFSSPVAGSLNDGICSINQAGVLRHKFIDEVTVGNATMKSRVMQVNSKSHGMVTGDATGKDASKSMSTNTKGPKLVIHLGSRNRNLTSSPRSRSDASSYQGDQQLATSNGNEDVGQVQIADKPTLDRHAKFGDGKVKARVSLGKRSVEKSTAAVETAIKVVPSIRIDKVPRKNMEVRPDVSSGGNSDGIHTPSGSQPLPKDSKPLLKLKFKNPYHENQSSWAPQVEDEKSSVKGQRSKRKRPSPLMEKTSTDRDASQWYEDNSMNEMMDANWILQKLGKDAIGKRVEVHQQSDNSWYKGVVNDVIEETSIISVALDDGRAKNFELGKQRIRFVSQKQKR